ncbi:thioredoxin-like domain-containing protein [Xylaria palmicola]|nr:thioredoxin-like domain-containing protein [Xylaria palmicola]
MYLPLTLHFRRLIDSPSCENSPHRKFLLLDITVLPGLTGGYRPGSQLLEPEWTSLSGSHKSLMSIDCSSEPAVCDEFGIISYPALRYFDGHGHMRSYRGPRRASAIISFLKRAVRPAITILDEERSNKFQSIDDTVFIAQINPGDEHAATAFQTIAAQYQDRASFGSRETTGTTTVMCYNNKDEQRFTLSDLTAINALPKLVESCLTPLIGEFTRANEMKYLQSGKSLVFFFATSLDEREAFVNTMRPVAKMYKDYLVFVTVDANEYADFAAPLGLTPGEFPALAVQNPMYGQTFPFDADAEISPENIGAFVMDIVQGKVKPWDGQSRQKKAQTHDEL